MFSDNNAKKLIVTKKIKDSRCTVRMQANKTSPHRAHGEMTANVTSRKTMGNAREMVVQAVNGLWWILLYRAGVP